MKEAFIFFVLCLTSVGVASFLGFSEGAGLFGAITGGGSYLALLISELKTKEQK